MIIPVLDAEDHIAEALSYMARQDYTGDWEVVVADNGCSDRTVEIVESWRAELPELRIVDARGRRGAAHARNVAAAAAHGDFLACCDADDVPGPGWLRGLAEAGQRGDLVRATSEHRLLKADLPDGWPPLHREGGLVDESAFRHVGGGRLAVWTDVARRVRWDESLSRSGEDVDFCWRAHLAGMSVVDAPAAVMNKRRRRGLPALARQGFRWGLAVPILRSRYGSSGLRASPYRTRARWRWLLEDVLSAPRSRAARARLVWNGSFALGRLAGWWPARGPAGRVPAEML